MGERKGQNKYYPPDFDPKKHRSLDAYHGTHALRERARKLDQGILVIRFEMPYNIWCEGCKKPIGMGVRYNAEKSKVGMYYTTPIYKFRMKCHLCKNYFEIKTDPATHDYVIINGARRKEQRWDPKENEQIVPEDKNDQKKLAADAMYKLEHGAEDVGRGKVALPKISQIAAVQEQWKDDYMLNKMIRQKFREEKKELKSAAEKDEDLLNRVSLDLDLVPEHDDDKHMAELLQYSTVQSYDEKQKEKREEIESRPLFNPPNLANLRSPNFTTTNGNSAKSTAGSHQPNPALKVLEVRKKLGQVVMKGKVDPFALNANKEIKSKESSSIMKLGIVRKQMSKSSQETIQDETGFNEVPAAEPQVHGMVDISAGTSDCGVTSEIASIATKERETGLQLINDSIHNSCTGDGSKNALNSLMSMYSDSSEESEG